MKGNGIRRSGHRKLERLLTFGTLIDNRNGHGRLSTSPERIITEKNKVERGGTEGKML